MKLINEERGVAAVTYNDVIKKIHDYIDNYVKFYVRNHSVNDGTNISFYIPKTITSKIDFIAENQLPVYVEVVFHDYERGLMFGKGSSSLFDSSHLTKDNKLNYSEIDILCYANTKGYIYSKSLYNTIYHEINHLYDTYSQMKNNGGSVVGTKYQSVDISRKLNGIKDRIDFYLFKKYNVNNGNIGEFFDYILYTLWSDTELNAFVSGVYGDLKAIHSTRENFGVDIKKTEAYFKYKEIRDNIKDILFVDDNIIECVMLSFLDNGINIGKDIETFKKKFYKITISKLDVLKRGIGKVASLYYDNSEDAKRIAEEYSKKHGSCNIEGQIVEAKPEHNESVFENFKRLAGIN